VRQLRHDLSSLRAGRPLSGLRRRARGRALWRLGFARRAFGSAPMARLVIHVPSS
jgi:hypothetical protein